MARTSSIAHVVSGALTGLLLAIAVSESAGAHPSVTTFGPHEHFVGLVNGQSTEAIIKMACTSPLSSTEMGHPLSGQTVAVEPSSSVAGTSGFTGSRGRSVVATFGVPTSTSNSSLLTFSGFGSQTLPDTILLPCSGSGKVVFSPQPTSKSAKSYTVTLTYGNITVDPPPFATRRSTASRTIIVTQADSGHSYRLHKGDVLDVQLSRPSGVVWSEPASSDQVVLQRTAGTSGATATGAFLAVGAGRAQATAVGSPNCSGACPTFLIAFEVKVSVVG